MARGDVAKVYVGDALKKSFGEDFIGYIDKKYYVWANDGSEKVQICINLTCPKSPIPTDKVPAFNTGIDFSDDKPAEISEQEQQDILDLMKKLGL